MSDESWFFVGLAIAAWVPHLIWYFTVKTLSEAVDVMLDVQHRFVRSEIKRKQRCLDEIEAIKEEIAQEASLDGQNSNSNHTDEAK